jgi:hypothetical protein
MRAASIENNDIKGIVTSQLNKIAKNLKKAEATKEARCIIITCTTNK